MVNSRGMLFMSVLAAVSMVGCENTSPLEPPPPTPVAVTITVADSDSIGIPGVSVTCLTGCPNQLVMTTDNSGRATPLGVEPLVVRVEKNRYVSVERQVSNGDTIVLQRKSAEATIAVVLPYPSEDIIPGTFAAYEILYSGVEGVGVTCLDGCQDSQTQTSNDQGEVTFFGMSSLRIRAEKAGYIPVTRTVSINDDDYGEVVVSHEWPSDLAIAISQLELADVINSGELLLHWNTNQPNRGRGHFFEQGFVYVDVFPNDRLASVWTLFHEAFHAWQWLKADRTDVLAENWHRSPEAQAYLEALAKDIEEHGPMPGLDDPWGEETTPSYKDPLENQASFFGEWNIGPCARKRGCGNRQEELAKMYEQAPNRAAYMEHYFGSPPP